MSTVEGKNAKRRMEITKKKPPVFSGKQEEKEIKRYIFPDSFNDDCRKEMLKHFGGPQRDNRIRIEFKRQETSE